MDYGAPPRYTPSSKRSAWKRPKPKVYECNERDAMRFYETSYNEYRRNKEDAEERRRAEMNRDILSEHPLSWRSSSLSRERPRPSREEEQPRRDPFKREGSYSGLSSTDSRSDGPTRLNSQSATDVDDNFQARLDRLKKLREELGLPQMNGTAESSSSSLSKSSAKESSESGYKSSFSSESKFGSTKKSALAVEEDDEVPTSRFLRAKATPGKDKDEDKPRENKWTKYTSYKEKREEDPEPEVVDPEEYAYKAKSRSSGWRSKLADDLSKCELYDNIDKDRKSPAPFSLKKNDYSFKSSGDVNGDSSFSSRSAYKSSSDVGGGSSKFSAASASSSSYKSKAMDMSDDYDVDDSVIASLSKKLPSSAEILERISKMNLDD